jgi:hypothetical protein
MSGSAELTNWARCVMVIEATQDKDVFEYQVAKSFEESGWVESKKYFAHTRRGGARFWSEATEEQIRKAIGAAPDPEDIVKFLHPDHSLITNQVVELAKKEGWNKEQVKYALEFRSQDGDKVIDFSGEPWVQTVFKVKIRKPKTRPADGWQSAPSTEDLSAIVLDAIPTGDGIKPDDLKAELYDIHGITKDETHAALVAMESASDIKCYSGEGSQHSATFIIRSSHEVEWRAAHPQSNAKSLPRS